MGEVLELRGILPDCQGHQLATIPNANALSKLAAEEQSEQPIPRGGSSGDRAACGPRGDLATNRSGPRLCLSWPPMYVCDQKTKNNMYEMEGASALLSALRGWRCGGPASHGAGASFRPWSRGPWPRGRPGPACGRSSGGVRGIDSTTEYYRIQDSTTKYYRARNSTTQHYKVLDHTITE